VSFAQALSGTRITQALQYVGVPAAQMDIGTGVSEMAGTDDLAGSNVLAHIQLIAEAENGRLFVSKDGKITFRDRHWELQNEQSDRATFSDQGTGIPYVLSGPVTHDESKIANVVRITPSSGNTQTARDQASIDDHFERVLEKSWPLAFDNDAQSAAEWLLFRLKDVQLRIPTITLGGMSKPSIWPTLLNMEIGQRYAFTYTPKGGGTPITRSVIIEGIEHSMSPNEHQVKVQLSPANTTKYWRLGVAGYSELDTTTRLAY